MHDYIINYRERWPPGPIPNDLCQTSVSQVPGRPGEFQHITRRKDEGLCKSNG